MLSKTGSVTLGAGLVDYIIFDVVDIVGGNTLRLKGVSCVNTTRPNADARKALVWIGQRGSTTGDDSSDVKIAQGFTSINGDLVELLPNNFDLDVTEMIGFRFEGENGDVCNARIGYEVV